MTGADNENKIKVTGTVENIIYSNEDNGYTICDVDTGDGDITTVVGYLPYIAEGDEASFYGRWVNNPKYGRQFSAESFEKRLPQDTASILRYLSSRTVKGIGPKTAQSIVEKFGEESFDVIENHPEWLADIPGISLKKAMAISDDFVEKAGMRRTMMFFREWFGAGLTVKIYKKWGPFSVDTVRNNPYRLCEEIDGIGFEKADEVARSIGFAENSGERVAAGIIYALIKCERGGGHICFPEKELISVSAELLSVSKAETEPAIKKLIGEQKLCAVTFAGEKYIYRRNNYSDEVFIAERLIKLEKFNIGMSFDDMDALIKKAETDNGITYADMQKKAIAGVLSSGVTVITGGPGTGKTTVVRALIRIFEDLSMKVALSAPTGRAAKRMSEATGHEAKTIHRLLEMKYSDDDETAVFDRDEDYPLEENVVIIDEASMMDNALTASLLRAVRLGTRLVIIGDSDQLPSVGPGNVLRDVIESGRFETIRLTEIFRQAEKSLIVTNAHKINDGEMPELDVKNNDFFFITRASDREISDTVSDLIANRLPRAYGEKIIEGIQVITPSRRSVCGSETLNVALQDKLNPKDPDKKEYICKNIVFRLGDRVMQTRNNYDIEWTAGNDIGTGIFNGDIGVITAIEHGAITVDFDDKTVVYETNDIEDLDPAYAITVHKSQGSEYDTVIIPAGNIPQPLITRNLLYTAVTRAAKRVIIVGRRDVIAEMVKNDKQSKRYTGLKYLLKV